MNSEEYNEKQKILDEIIMLTVQMIKEEMTNNQQKDKIEGQEIKINDKFISLY